MAGSVNTDIDSVTHAPLPWWEHFKPPSVVARLSLFMMDEHHTLRVGYGTGVVPNLDKAPMERIWEDHKFVMSRSPDSARNKRPLH